MGKIICQIVNDGLQVRVGGGWMGAVPFLERYGPISMISRSPSASPQCSPRSSSRTARNDHSFEGPKRSPYPQHSARLLEMGTKYRPQSADIRTETDNYQQRGLHPEEQFLACMTEELYSDYQKLMTPSPTSSPVASARD